MFKFKRLRSTIATRMGFSQLKESYSNVASVAKELIQPIKREDNTPETFEEAITRLNVQPEDLERKKTVFFRTALIYFGMAVALFVYLLVLIVSGTILGLFIDTVLIIMMLSLAYREHFCYTQIKYKRLGITFQEWMAYTFGLKRGTP